MEYIPICYFCVTTEYKPAGWMYNIEGQAKDLINIVEYNIKKQIVVTFFENKLYYFKVISYKEYQATVLLDPLFPEHVKNFISYRIENNLLLKHEFKKDIVRAECVPR